MKLLKNIIENINNPKLLIPVGISGSGKSTWIKSNINSNTIIVSPDEIRKKLTSDISNQTKNGEVWSIAFNEIANALNNKNVILDATNISSTDIKRLINYLKQHVNKPFNAYLKIFITNPEIPKERIKNDI